MKPLIAGSRSITYYPYLLEGLRFFPSITEIISGGARGADSLAEYYAKEKNIPCSVIKPNWDEYGRSAGYIRNQIMVDMCDQGLVLWDGKSKGSKHTIGLLKKANKPFVIGELNDNHMEFISTGGKVDDREDEGGWL